MTGCLRTAYQNRSRHRAERRSGRCKADLRHSRATACGLVRAARCVGWNRPHAHRDARWLHDGHGVQGWWSQNVTVAYERARGMRAPHELPGGFSVGVSKTVALSADRALAAFTDSAQRRRWLTGASMRQRPTRAANTARFDWADPPAIDGRLDPTERTDEVDDQRHDREAAGRRVRGAPADGVADLVGAVAESARGLTGRSGRRFGRAPRTPA